MAAKKKPPVPMLAGVEVQRLVAEYEEGRSLRDIAAEIGVSHVHLARIIKANGATMRKRSSSRNPQTANALRAKRLAIQSAHAAILYSYGVDADEIAVSLGRTVDWVRQEVHAAGVALRK